MGKENLVSRMMSQKPSITAGLVSLLIGVGIGLGAGLKIGSDYSSTRNAYEVRKELNSSNRGERLEIYESGPVLGIVKKIDSTLKEKTGYYAVNIIIEEDKEGGRGVITFLTEEELKKYEISKGSEVCLVYRDIITKRGEKVVGSEGRVEILSKDKCNKYSDSYGSNLILQKQKLF